MQAITPQDLVSIGKRAFLVSGMHWETFDAGRNNDNKMLLLAKQLGANKFVSFTNWFTQIGFSKIVSSSSRDRHFSLAAAVHLAAIKADCPSSWIGIFKLDGAADRWWMLAVGESVILAESDFAGSFAAVRDRFIHFAAMRDWEAVIAPDSLLSDEWIKVAPVVKPIELSAWINAKVLDEPLLRSSEMLRTDYKVRAKRMMVIAAVAVIVIAGIGGSGYIWFEKRMEAERLATQAAENAARAAEAAARVANEKAAQASLAIQGAMGATIERVVAEQPKPWLNIAPVPLFAIGCMRAISGEPANPSGWSLQSSLCDGSMVNSNYVRGNNGAPVGRFARRYADATIQPDGESATRKSTLSIPQTGREEKLLTYAEATLKLNDRFQVLGVKVPLREVPLPPNTFRSAGEIPKEFSTKDTPMIQGWRTIAFFVATSMPPTLLSSAFDMPGVRLRSIRVAFPAVSNSASPGDAPQVTYQIDGEMYAN